MASGSSGCVRDKKLQRYLAGATVFRCGRASRSGTIFANRKRVSRWRRQSAMCCAPCLRVPTKISTMTSCWSMKTADSLGFIGTETLFKVQNALLLTNIREIEERDREIRQKNEQMETDLRMATELQQALMPSTYPTFPADAAADATKLSFCHRYLAATQMGGDFFHIARLKRRHSRRLYLRCNGPWRPRSADHRDDARHDRNSRN